MASIYKNSSNMAKKRRVRNDITWLTSHLDSNTFGWKASRLSSVFSIEANIPIGFAISRNLVTRLATHSASEDDWELLKCHYADLQIKAGSHSLIVRSSSCVENTDKGSFAGLFKTTPNIHNFEELILAIIACAESSRSREIKLYSKLKGLTLPDEHLALLVQKQIKISYSALAQISRTDTFLELYGGDLAEPIQGVGIPDLLLSKSAIFRRKTQQGSPHITEDLIFKIRRVCSDIRNILERIGWKGNATLEIGADDDTLYLLQINGANDSQMVDGVISDSPPFHNPISRNFPELGLKGAAMKYFSDSGLFQVPVCVMPYTYSQETIDDKLQEKLPTDSNFTLRFSHQLDLGLPRHFIEDRSLISKFACATRKKNWTTIVHPYLEVAHSFELLLTQNKALFEHIPGMWESDNELDPDVIILQDQYVSTWRYKLPRSAKFATPPGWTFAITPPTTLSNLNLWLRRLSPIIDKLRLDFRFSLPLNFHFVEDKSGFWHFLNIREGFEFSESALTTKEPHIVNCAADLDKWDKHSPLLLRLQTARGSESEIVAIAAKLPNPSSFPIIVDFGLLSHPAMILRELGFRLIPNYLHHGSHSDNLDYETMQHKIDIGNDPIERIRAERSIYMDEDIKIVPDIDPIAPGHLLVMANDSIESFFDGEKKDILRRLYSLNIPGFPRDWIFFERGRAAFCSSGFTNSHAHGHIFPQHEFPPNTLENFAEFIGAQRASSQNEVASIVASHEGEYFLMADSKGIIYLKMCGRSALHEKRLIRNFLSQTRI